MSARLDERRRANVTALISEFARYLAVFEHDPPFRRYGQWEFHRETIQLRYKLGSAAAALESDEFLEILRKTLQAWGIGIRGSRLLPMDEFKRAIRAKTPEITFLEKFAIGDPTIDANLIKTRVWPLIDGLKITNNKSQIVAATKALHHLLPELIVPIDRAYTQNFFCWQSQNLQYKQEDCVQDAFSTFTQIATKIDAARYVAEGWNTSRTKVLDNAIIGFILADELARPQLRRSAKPTIPTAPTRPSTSGLFGSLIDWARRQLAIWQR